MAVKANATITLSFMVDVKAVYRYYKLQSSTASAPSVPTTATPSGWTDVEPTYTEGSTNTLYFVDKTVFTNDSFVYSLVSKSTSYEAAKTAYNKAVAANTTANTALEATEPLINLRNNFQGTDGNPKWYHIGYVPYDVLSGINYSHLRLHGRTGGWVSQNTGFIDVTFASRGSNSNYNVVERKDANAMGNSECPWDLFVYTGEDGYTHYYMRMKGYGLFELYAEYSQLTLVLDFIDSEPTGTCTWKLSEQRTTLNSTIDDFSLSVTTNQQEMRLDFTNAVASASNDLQSQMQTNNDAVNQKLGEINKYIRFVNGNIVLGAENSELVLSIIGPDQNDDTTPKVSFTQAGVEVAYFSSNKLYIKRAEVLTTLKVGNYEFAPRNDGGLSLRKRSD